MLGGLLTARILGAFVKVMMSENYIKFALFCK